MSKTYEEKLADLEQAKKELEKSRKNEVIKLLEKYSGKITNLPAFEAYLQRYGDFIKKSQTEAKTK